MFFLRAHAKELVVWARCLNRHCRIYRVTARQSPSLTQSRSRLGPPLNFSRLRLWRGRVSLLRSLRPSFFLLFSLATTAEPSQKAGPCLKAQRGSHFSSILSTPLLNERRRGQGKQTPRLVLSLSPRLSSPSPRCAGRRDYSAFASMHARTSH